MYAIGSNSANRGAELKALLSGHKHTSRKLKRAQSLLAADGGASDEEIGSDGVGGPPCGSGPSGAL